MSSLKLPTLEEKTCKVCLVVKPIHEFNPTIRRHRGERNKCKNCWADYCRDARYKSNGAYLEREYNSKLERSYGITRTNYDYLLEVQNGVCAICGLKDGDKTRYQRLSVDHCHDTGRIRGLLCNNCNRCLGLAKDDAKLLGKMKQYLEGRI